MIITLSQFKKAMDEALEKHEEELTLTWDKLSFGEYTAVWERNGEKSGVYQSLAKKLGMKWHGQYWNLDAVFFKEWSKHSDGFGASFLSLVIEHENQCDTSPQEINRLLAASASLKVLVTYPYSDYVQESPKEHTDEKTISQTIGSDSGQKWLNKYVKQIEIFDDIWPGHSAQQRYVVIFGGEDKNKKSVWKYYIYRQGEFCSF